MLKHLFSSHSSINAVVEEVLPSTGLAYLTDENKGSWTLTRSTPGVDLERLRPGQRGTLMVADHGDFSIASGFAALD